jgi:hypothetical protein
MSGHAAVRLSALLPPLAAAVLLGACTLELQHGSAPAAAALPAVIAGVAGEYDTRRQFEAAPADLRREPAAGHPYDWLDRQHAVFHWVQAPSLGEHVLLLEWRRGGPTGPISRQRLWVFERRQGGWVMDFFTLPEADVAAPGSKLDADFTALRREQLIGYGPACSLIATGIGSALEFSIPPTCSIVSRSGRRMQLSAVVRFTDGELRYREQGMLEDGAIAFLVPGRSGLDYVFERIARP